MQSIKLWQKDDKGVYCNCYVIHRTSSYSSMSCIYTVRCEVRCIIDYVDTHPHQSSISWHHPTSNINLPKHHHWKALLGVSKNRGTPKWVVKILENLIKWKTYFRKHPADQTNSQTATCLGPFPTLGHPLSMRLGGTTLCRTFWCCRGGDQDVGNGILAGGFKYFIFSPLPGEDFQFD